MTSGRRIPQPRKQIFLQGSLLQKHLTRTINHQQMDRTVSQPAPVHFATGQLPRHPVLLIHYIE